MIRVVLFASSASASKNKTTLYRLDFIFFEVGEGDKEEAV